MRPTNGIALLDKLTMFPFPLVWGRLPRRSLRHLATRRVRGFGRRLSPFMLGLRGVRICALVRKLTNGGVCALFSVTEILICPTLCLRLAV